MKIVKELMEQEVAKRIELDKENINLMAEQEIAHLNRGIAEQIKNRELRLKKIEEQVKLDFNLSEIEYNQLEVILKNFSGKDRKEYLKHQIAQGGNILKNTIYRMYNVDPTDKTIDISLENLGDKVKSIKLITDTYSLVRLGLKAKNCLKHRKIDEDGFYLDIELEDKLKFIVQYDSNAKRVQEYRQYNQIKLNQEHQDKMLNFIGLFHHSDQLKNIYREISNKRKIELAIIEQKKEEELTRLLSSLDLLNEDLRNKGFEVGKWLVYLKGDTI